MKIHLYTFRPNNIIFDRDLILCSIPRFERGPTIPALRGINLTAASLSPPRRIKQPFQRALGLALDLSYALCALRLA